MSKGKIKTEGGNTAELEGFGNFSHQWIPDSRDPTPDHQNPEPESPRGGSRDSPLPGAARGSCGPATARGGQSATERRGATLPKALGDKLQPKSS